MFDDLMNAGLLVAVIGIAVAVTVDGSGMSSATAPAAAAGVATAPPAGTTPGVMPVYDLPRVVVTGQRQRDGDLLADGSAPPALPPARPDAPATDMQR